MVYLGRLVQGVARRREELEHLAIKRWNTLDTLVLRSLGMFLGALFVSLMLNFKPDDMEVGDWYSIRLVITLAIDPLILLYITKYSPPTSVQIENGSDTLEFRVVDSVKLSFYVNSNVVMPDIEAIELTPKSSEVVLKDYEGDSPEANSKPLTIKIVGKTWPKKELSHALSMLSSMNEGEFTGCAGDMQVLTSKVVVQVLSWTIRDFIANSLFHTWNVSVWEDLAFALVLFLIFTVLTWITKLFALKSYSKYHNPPFLSVKERWQTSLSRILSTYVEVTLGCLPLSVGYSFNQVCRDLHMEVMSKAEVQMTDATRSDYYGSVVLFSFAVYFLILAVVTVSLRVYAQSIFHYIFAHRLIRKLVDFIDITCCCSVCKHAPPEEGPPASSEKGAEAAAPAKEASEPVVEQSAQDSAPHPPLQHAVTAPLPPRGDMENGERDTAGSPASAVAFAHAPGAQPAVPEPSPPPGVKTEAVEMVEYTVAVLEKKVKKLERALGIAGPSPGREADEVEFAAVINRHWKAVTVATADEVSIKTLQFLFAWATLYLLEHFFFIYIVECSRSSSDPWSTTCTFQSSLALSLFLSVTSFVYLYMIAGLRRQTDAHKAFFDLQTQAIPLTVGWTWKGFADDIVDKLSAEWEGYNMAPVYIALFVTMYIFGILVMHTYSIISRDTRAKYASLEFQ